jgi:CheY-like chemotaxis protein
MNRQKLIFIVDDDPFINMLVVKRLIENGYNIEAFKYGEDCLNALDREPDLIILDYFFVNGDRQVMDGMQVFEKLKKLRPDTPVIILSGQEKGEIVLEFARKGIDDYIIKDNNIIKNLLAAIGDMFEGDKDKK